MVAVGEAHGPQAGFAALAELDPMLPRYTASAAWAPPNQASGSLTAYNHRGLLLRQLHICVDVLTCTADWCEWVDVFGRSAKIWELITLQSKGAHFSTGTDTRIAIVVVCGTGPDHSAARSSSSLRIWFAQFSIVDACGRRY